MRGTACTIFFPRIVLWLFRNRLAHFISNGYVPTTDKPLDIIVDDGGHQQVTDQTLSFSLSLYFSVSLELYLFFLSFSFISSSLLSFFVILLFFNILSSFLRPPVPLFTSDINTRTGAHFVFLPTTFSSPCSR
jgi:hypothetical protein